MGSEMCIRDRLKTLEHIRRLVHEEMPQRAERIRAAAGEIARLEPHLATAGSRRGLVEHQLQTLERHVGTHDRTRRWRGIGELVLLVVMAVGETMLAYPAFKEAVPTSTGGVSDPIIIFLVSHGALFAAAAIGAGSAWLQRVIGMELAHALRSVLGEHKDGSEAEGAF